MSAKGQGKNVKALLGLIDAEGYFAHGGHRWLKADQPTIASEAGLLAAHAAQHYQQTSGVCTLRTRLGGKNFTLIRRADPKSANRQIDQSKSANRQVGTPNRQMANSPNRQSRQPNRQKSRARSNTAPDARSCARSGSPINASRHRAGDEVGVRPALELAKRGITPAEFRYVLANWQEFLTCVNALCLEEATGNSKLKAYQARTLARHDG